MAPLQLYFNYYMNRRVKYRIPVKLFFETCFGSVGDRLLTLDLKALQILILYISDGKELKTLQIDLCHQMFKG